MDNNIYKLLMYLANTGVGVEKNIAEPLSEIFVPPAVEDRPHYASLLQRFLQYLIDDNLIHMTDRPDRSLGEKHDTQGYRWLGGDWPISAAITLHGYDLLSLEIARQNKTDLDSSIKKTNNATNANILLTAIFTFIIIYLELSNNIRERKRDITQKEQIRRDSIQYVQQEGRDESLKISLDSIRLAISTGFDSLSRSLNVNKLLSP